MNHAAAQTEPAIVGEISRKLTIASDDRERSRRDMSLKLKSDIARGDKPVYERRIYIQLPKEDQHKDHAIGEVCLLQCNDDKRALRKSDSNSVQRLRKSVQYTQ
jgi:hypothetical protein